MHLAIWDAMGIKMGPVSTFSRHASSVVGASNLLAASVEFCRHLINLSSDLLAPQDFYWDRERLEKLHLQMRGYLSITKRTEVSARVRSILSPAHTWCVTRGMTRKIE